LTVKPGHKSPASKPAPRRPNFIPSTPDYLKYNWRDRDPDMDLILGLIGESGLSPEDIEDETARLGWKVSRYTIMRWLYGGTMRPQNYTMTIVALALGYSKTWAPTSGTVARPFEDRSVDRPVAKPEGRRNVHH